MFEKTITTMWIDNDSFNMYLISIDDNGIFYLTERLPEHHGN
jgi:hypothetical protein